MEKNYVDTLGRADCKAVRPVWMLLVRIANELLFKLLLYCPDSGLDARPEAEFF